MFENTCLTLDIHSSCSPNGNNISMITNNLKDVWTWQEIKLNIGVFYEIWSWAEGIFWQKYCPNAFGGAGGWGGVCDSVLFATEREKSGPIFIPPWRLRQLCQKSTTMATLWLGCYANMHTDSLCCLHSCAHFFLIHHYYNSILLCEYISN